MFFNLKPLVLVSICCVTAWASGSHAAAPSILPAQAAPQSSPLAVSSDAKERSRLEELFIWKTSEELRLAPAEELKFTQAIHLINLRRRAANANMDDAVKALAAAKTKAQAEKALAAHRAALRETQSVATAELDRLKPLLGAEKLAQYIVVKNSILEKLKAMLAAPAIASGSAAPAAKVSASASDLSAAKSAKPDAAAGTASGMTSSQSAPAVSGASAEPKAAAGKSPAVSASAPASSK